MGSRVKAVKLERQHRGHRYVDNEHRIPTNRVVEALEAIRQKEKLTALSDVAPLVGLNWRVIYRLKKHRVLPLDLSYLHLWARYSGRPIEYLTGEWL